MGSSYGEMSSNDAAAGSSVPPTADAAGAAAAAPTAAASAASSSNSSAAVKPPPPASQPLPATSTPATTNGKDNSATGAGTGADPKAQGRSVLSVLVGKLNSL